MKKILITSILFSMNIFSQTPPNPPTPPTAKSGVSTSNIVYSIAETDNSYAFACSFKSKFHDIIKNIIRTEYEFKEDLEKIGYISESNSSLSYKIELKETELKMECKSNFNSSEDFIKFKIIQFTI